MEGNIQNFKGKNKILIYSLKDSEQHQGEYEFGIYIFNQYSITLLGIHVRHTAYKSEKYAFINANMKVINTILKANRKGQQTNIKVQTLFVK